MSRPIFRSVLILSFVLLVPSVCQARWKKTNVSKGGGYSSIAIDAAGRPHISFLDDSNASNFVLRHAFLNGKRWKVEIVDSGDVGWWSSIAIDSAGHIHIVYHADKPTSSLRHAYFDGVAWNITTVGSGGFSNHLTLDSQDRPHVSYVDNSNSLLHAWFDGVTWMIETIANNALWFGNTSIALDSSDKVHISFSDLSLPRKLLWATNVSGTWEVAQVDEGRGSSLALDSFGNPHILYNAESVTELRFISYNGTSWGPPQILIDGPVDSPSLALDSSNHPHISFGLFAGRQALIYGHFNGTTWTAQVVDAGNSGFDTSLALDVAGRPHISSRRPTGRTSSLRYATLLP